MIASFQKIGNPASLTFLIDNHVILFSWTPQIRNTTPLFFPFDSKQPDFNKNQTADSKNYGKWDEPDEHNDKRYDNPEEKVG